MTVLAICHPQTFKFIRGKMLRFGATPPQKPCNYFPFYQPQTFDSFTFYVFSASPNYHPYLFAFIRVHLRSIIIKILLHAASF
ncbi:hypothetical protein [Aphanizomenon sp. CS-733/32]|uniref:hypothetical protein n=1 Tax=Aphanizomenon sp. CS-733/32 TaxID=3021715 RepID=UPI00232EA7E9|nr:hypothetical protein [Aphanizomenon sp. CS-733/32]